MPLKIAAVLQRSLGNPEGINGAIEDYWEMFTHGNKFVQLRLDLDDDDMGENFERPLVEYVKELGFAEDAIILVDKNWDVVQPRVVRGNVPEPVGAPIDDLLNEPPIQVNL